MGQITSGVVRYERTLNLDDYNSKKAAAEIAFSANDTGSDYQHMLDLAGTTAIAKVHELLALAEKAPATTAAPAPAAKAEPAPTGSKADLEAAARSAAGATKAATNGATEPKAEPKKGAKKPPATPAAPAPAADDIDLTEGPAGDSADEDLSDVLGGEAKPPVTDEELTSRVTRKAAESKNPKAIRALVEKFAGPLPNGVRQVPPLRRHEFLSELDTIKAPA